MVNTSVEKIINLWYIKNQGDRLTIKFKSKRKENPETPFRDALKREIEEEKFSKNPYANKIIAGLPIYTASFIKSNKGELVGVIIEKHYFDRYF